MGFLGFLELMRSGRQVRGRKDMVLGGCPATLGMVPSAALATPGSGVSGTVLATGTSAGTMKVETQGPTDVVVRTITIAPGGSTGWHHHPGQLIAVVQKGTLSRTLDDCSVETTTAGQSFIEPSGAEHRHIGRNLGSEPVVLYLTYMLPTGSPLSVDADAPACETGGTGKAGE